MLTEWMRAQCAQYEETRAGWQFVPLRVTATLTQPISITRPQDLQFDGLIAHTILHALFEHEAYTLPDVREAWIWVPLPFAMQGACFTAPTGALLTPEQIAAPWWYACSTPLLDVQGHTKQFWNKRFRTGAESDFLDFGKKRGTIVIEAGTYKAYHQPLMLLQTHVITWHVVGDRAMLTEAVRHISAIGKKRGYGYGAVQNWTIEPDDADHSLYTADGTLLARPVPIAALGQLGYTGSYAQEYIAFRAPGWLPANQTLCAV